MPIVVWAVLAVAGGACFWYCREYPLHGQPADDVMALVLAGYEAAIAAVALLWTRHRVLRPVHQLARLVEEHQDKSDFIGVLAEQRDDELGRIAHEMAVLARLADRTESEKEELARTVQQAHGRTAAVVNALALPLIFLDEQGRVMMANRAAGRMIGWKPQAAARKAVGALLPVPFDSGQVTGEEVFRRVSREAKPGGPALRFRGRARSAGGEELAVELRLIRLAVAGKPEYLLELATADGGPAEVRRPVEKQSSGSSQRDVAGVKESVPSAPMASELRTIELGEVVSGAVSELSHGTASEMRLMKPDAAYVRGHIPSVEFAVREILRHCLAVSEPGMPVSVTITETPDSVGIMVEAAVARDVPEASHAVSGQGLGEAADAIEGIGGTLNVYTDLPGVFQVVTELMRDANPAQSHDRA